MTVHDNSTIGFIRHPNNVSALQRHSYIFSCEYQPVGTDNGISGPEWVIYSTPYSWEHSSFVNLRPEVGTFFLLFTSSEYSTAASYRDRK